MKKSWHPLLFSNQERVWKKEKEALAEKKKLAELQKELAQERAVQELMDLQAKAGGGKREQRVEWMYAAPAEGNGPNAEELEAYLLGKKRVDKLLQGNEEKMMAAPSTSAPGGAFTSIQNANSARDTAAKIREDPLLAIKRQEQAQYEKILKNPQRLKELRAAREAATPAPKKSKKDETKEERRARKDAKRAKEDDERYGGRKRGGRHDSRSRSRSRSPPPKRPHYDDYSRDNNGRSHGSKYDDERREDSRGGRRYEDEDYDRRSSHRQRSPPPAPRESSSYDNRAPPPPRDYDNGPSRHQRPVASDFDNNYRSSGPSSYNRRPPVPAQPTEEEERARKQAAEEKLAAMQSSAAALAAERNARLTKLEAEDKEQLDRENAARQGRGKGMAPSFLREQEKKVFTGGMDLGERMKRSGRVGMVGDRD